MELQFKAVYCSLTPSHQQEIFGPETIEIQTKRSRLEFYFSYYYFVL